MVDRFSTALSLTRNSSGWSWLLCAGWVGAQSTLLQTFCAREALVSLGGSELVIGVVLSAWYLGLAVGALSSAHAQSHAAPWLAAALLLAQGMLAPLAIAALRICHSWIGVPAGELVGIGHLLLATLPTVGLISALSGALFPIVCKLAARTQVAATGVTAGQVYGVEALASLAIGLLLSLLLLPALSVETMLSAALVASCAVAGMLLWLDRRRGAASAMAFFCCASALGAALQWPAALDESSRAQRFATLGHGYERLVELDTRYQNLVLAAATAEIGQSAHPVAVFMNGHHAMTVPDPHAQASRVHLVLAQHPAPQQVLIIGGASLGALNEYALHNIHRLDYVDIDPALIELLQSAPGQLAAHSLAQPFLHPIAGDFRTYLRDVKYEYDLIFIDITDPSSALLNRAFTAELYQDVRRALRPGGCVVTRAELSDSFLSASRVQPAASIWAALGTAFAQRIALPGAETLLAAAVQPGVVSDDAAVLRARLQRRQLRSRYFSPQELPVLVPQRRVAGLRERLDTAGVAANSDTRPATYLYNLALLARASDDALAKALLRLQRVPGWAIGALLLLFGAVAAWRSSHGSERMRQGAVWAVLASTGATGAALSLLLLLAFQNNFGVIFQALATLVGVFMLGLASGSLLAAQRLHQGTASWRLLRQSEVAHLVAIVLAGLGLLGTSSWPGAPAALLLALALALSGFCVGLSFAAAAGCLPGDVGRVASLADALDCLGAAAGALLCSIIAIPVYGLTGTVLLLLALKLATLAPLLTARRR